MKGRSSGILLPIFSLPRRLRHRLIGWGSPAFHRLSRRRPSARVADSSPCSHGGGDSPYMSPSAFAGNPWFLDLEDLAALGLLTREELSGARCPDPDHVDYAWLHATRLPLLRRAWARDSDRASRTAFLESQPGWLPRPRPLLRAP